MSRQRPRQPALAHGLTPRQVEVVRLIAAHLRERGRPPTMRWLADRLGVRFPNGVRCHLWALQKLGVVRVQHGTAGVCLCGLGLRLECDGTPAGRRLAGLLGRAARDDDTFEQGGGI